MTMKRGEAQARTYTHPDLPGVEAIEIVVYSPDGQTDELDTTIVNQYGALRRCLRPAAT